MAKNRVIVGYSERHHIIPKCLDGTNSKTNIVRLTVKEHYVCHKLLCEIYPNENKLKWCFGECVILVTIKIKLEIIK